MAEPDYSKVFDAYNRLPPDIKERFDDFRVQHYVKGSPPPNRCRKIWKELLQSTKQEQKVLLPLPAQATIKDGHMPQV